MPWEQSSWNRCILGKSAYLSGFRLCKDSCLPLEVVSILLGSAGEALIALSQGHHCSHDHPVFLIVKSEESQELYKPWYHFPHTGCKCLQKRWNFPKPGLRQGLEPVTLHALLLVESL